MVLFERFNSSDGQKVNGHFRFIFCQWAIVDIIFYDNNPIEPVFR